MIEVFHSSLKPSIYLHMVSQIYQDICKNSDPSKKKGLRKYLKVLNFIYKGLLFWFFACDCRLLEDFIHLLYKLQVGL